MIFRPLFFSFVVLFALIPMTPAQTEPSLRTLEELVEIWSELQIEIATEKRVWDEQKSFMKSEISLLEKSITDLEDEIATFEDFSSMEEQERLQNQKRIEALTSKLEAWLPLLETTEAWILSYTNRLPPGLKPKETSDSGKRIVDRIQLLVSKLTELEELQSGFHLRKEMLEDKPGSKREMDVLYFGLARAFAVSSNNDWAGVGIPSEKGWVWQPAPDLAPEIRSVIRMYENKRAAEFISLPFKLPSQEKQP